MKQLLILAFLALFLPAQAIKADKALTKDSLLRIYLASPPDTSRLKILHKISLLDPLSPTFLYYQDKILDEAVAQKNVNYQSMAIYYHILYYYNRLDEKHAVQWAQRLEQLAQKHNYYTDYSKAKQMLIELYTVNHKIELAINEAQNMYEQAQELNDRAGMREAKLCLLSSYFETMRYKEGVEALNKALELTLPSDPPLAQVNLYSKAVLVYSALHDNNLLYQYLKETEKAFGQFLKQSSSILHNTYPELLLFIETHHALYYTRLQQPEKAWPHLQKAETYHKTSVFVPYQVAYLTACAEYYRLIREEDKALKYWDDAIEQIEPISSKDAMSYCIQKADLLVEMGKSEEALLLYKKTIRIKDSLYNNLATSQMEEIQSLYNMDKLMLEQEQQRSMYHYVCLSISIIFIIALLLFNIHAYKGRKRLQKDEKEMRKLTIIAEEANEVKSRFLTNMSYNIRIPLNNVVGFSQLMTEDNTLNEEEKKEYSGIIQKNSTELIQLVNDVLDLSRLEARMMKFQLQDCNVQEWYNDFMYMIREKNDGSISFQLHAETGDAVINTDVSRFTQAVSSMLFYPVECKEPREVRMEITYNQAKKEIVGRVENSPLTDPAFCSQKVSIRQEINRLFFEHFNGTYQIESSYEGVPALLFTYPTLTP